MRPPLVVRRITAAVGLNPTASQTFAEAQDTPLRLTTGGGLRTLTDQASADPADPVAADVNALAAPTVAVRNGAVRTRHIAAAETQTSAIP